MRSVVPGISELVADVGCEGEDDSALAGPVVKDAVTCVVEVGFVESNAEVVTDVGGAGEVG
jgi:hypothetical protein